MQSEQPAVLGHRQALALIASHDGREHVDKIAEGLAAGDVHCPARVAHALFVKLAELARADRRRAASESLDVSLRQLQIVRLLAHGLGNDEIAARLFVTPGTVKSHVRLLLRTLGLVSRQQAVAHAEQRGWLEVYR